MAESESLSFFQSNRWLLLALGVLVLLAVGRVIYVLALIAKAIYDDHRESKQPKPKWRDPELGEFTFEAGSWTTCTQIGGIDVALFLNGTQASPSPEALQTLRDISSRFAELKSTAIGFLSKETELTKSANLDPYSIIIDTSENKLDFTIEFTNPIDSDSIWGVEFKDGAPSSWYEAD